MAGPETADAAWPQVGDPPFGFNDAPDCPASAHPGGPVYPLPVFCTRDAGHVPPHVADGLDRVVHVWVGDDDLQRAALANPDAALALFAFLLGPADDDTGGE